MSSETRKSEIWPIVAVLLLGGFIVCALASIPFVLVQDLPRRSLVLVATLVAICLFESVFALVLAMDAGAFLYGTRRPYFANSSRVRLILSEPGANNAFGFALTSLGSYFLILSVFAVSYSAICQFDPGSFTQPLTTVSAVYYTIGNAVTAGAGEIAAKSPLARVATTIEYCISFLYNIFIFAGLAGFAARRAGPQKALANDA